MGGGPRTRLHGRRARRGAPPDGRLARSGTGCPAGEGRSGRGTHGFPWASPRIDRLHPFFRKSIFVPKIVDKILRMGEGKILKQLEAVASQVNALEDEFKAMSDDELQGMTEEFRGRLAE